MGGQAPISTAGRTSHPHSVKVVNAPVYLTQDRTPSLPQSLRLNFLASPANALHLQRELSCSTASRQEASPNPPDLRLPHLDLGDLTTDVGFFPFLSTSYCLPSHSPSCRPPVAPPANAASRCWYFVGQHCWLEIGLAT